jgi:hypothetical protein
VGEYDIGEAERRDKARALAEAESKAAAEADRITELLPRLGEPRVGWFARVFGRVGGWLKKPRSRIGWALAVSAGLLCQGCSTSGPKMLGGIGGAAAGFVMYHNYKVAQSEAWEKDEVAAGRLPLSLTNEALIRSDPFGYGLATFGGGVFGWGVAAWAEDRAEGDTVVEGDTIINEAPPAAE